MLVVARIRETGERVGRWAIASEGAAGSSKYVLGVIAEIRFSDSAGNGQAPFGLVEAADRRPQLLAKQGNRAAHVRVELPGSGKGDGCIVEGSTACGETLRCAIDFAKTR